MTEQPAGQSATVPPPPPPTAVAAPGRGSTPSRRAPSRRAPSVVWALAAGAILAAAFPPWGLPILLPLGVAMLLKEIEGAPARKARAAGFLCGLTYFGGTMFWLRNLFGWRFIGLIALMAGFIWVFTLIYTWLRARLPRLSPIVVAPVVWVAVEYYRSELFPLAFGWMGLGYAVIDAPVFARAASWIGSYGLALLIVMLAALVLRMRRRPAVALAIAAWGVALLVPLPTPAPERPIRVRLVQAPLGEADTMAALSQRGGRTDFVVWPEYATSYDLDPPSGTMPPYLARNIAETLAATGAYLILGAEDHYDTRDPDRFYNTAYVIAPDGEIIAKHVKNHTVHFLNDGTPGREALAVDTVHGRIGVAICFDMDFPDVARRLAADGAEAFLIPNDDPPEWGDTQRAQHRLMFQMRAAETGRWLARADVAGGTSVCAPDGQQAAWVESSEPATLDAEIGRESGLTPYVRVGWLIGPACLALLAIAVLAALRAPRRE